MIKKLFLKINFCLTYIIFVILGIVSFTIDINTHTLNQEILADIIAGIVSFFLYLIQLKLRKKNSVNKRFSVDVWDYHNDNNKFKKAMKIFSKSKTLVMILDKDDQDSFLMIGRGENLDQDIHQANQIADFVNSEKFVLRKDSK